MNYFSREECPIFKRNTIVQMRFIEEGDFLPVDLENNREQ